MGHSPTREEIARFCDRGLAPWVDAMARFAPQLVAHYGFNRLEWCHFMGQIGAETNGMSLAEMRESMYFTTASRIVQVYSYRLRIAISRANKGDPPAIARGRSVASLANKLRGQPTLLADIVYGGREGTPWMQGSRYIGRGPTQTTHFNGYKAVAEEIARQPGGAAIDLLANPELLATDPEIGIRAAFADWHNMGLRKYALADDVRAVSGKLNTGSPKKTAHNLAGRQRWTAKAKGVWPAGTVFAPPEDVIVDAPVSNDNAPAPVDVSEVSAIDAEIGTVTAGVLDRDPVLSEGAAGAEVEELQHKLVAAGYQVGHVDGKFGVLTRRAVVLLQSEHGLAVDGIVGQRTWDVLESTAPAEMPEREGITASVLLERGSTQILLWRRIKRFGQALLAVSGLGSLLGINADTSNGLEALENASNTVDRVDGIAQKFAEPNLFMTPKGWLLLALGGTAIVSIVLLAWAKSGENDRVQKARTGKDISK